MSRQKNYADAASDQVAAQKARQKRVDYAATHSPAELFKHFNTSQQGLNDSQVAQSRSCLEPTTCSSSTSRQLASV